MIKFFNKLKKTKNPIPTKRPDRRTKGQTEERTDPIFCTTYPATTKGPKSHAEYDLNKTRCILVTVEEKGECFCFKFCMKILANLVKLYYRKRNF